MKRDSLSFFSFLVPSLFPILSPFAAATPGDAPDPALVHNPSFEKAAEGSHLPTDWYAGSRWCPASIRTVADEEPLVRARVREYRDHPALLAWYLNDELPQQFLRQLEAHQRWVVEEDPHHPTWVVLYQVKEVSAYISTFDVIGTDPYPIGRKSASMAAEWTAETFRQVDQARPLWQVPQLHNWANYQRVHRARRSRALPPMTKSAAWPGSASPKVQPVWCSIPGTT